MNPSGSSIRRHQSFVLKSDAFVKFPQLLVSPGLVAILWNGLFDRFEPLDPRALMKAHFDIILNDGRAS